MRACWISTGAPRCGRWAASACRRAVSRPARRRYAEVRLRLATGSPQGVYFTLGEALATAWQRRVGPARTARRARPPTGRSTTCSCSPTASADVAFNQIDTAADRIARTAPGDPAAPRALARIYDDVVHVVVPAASPLTSVAQLRGARVSLGSPGSGVLFMAQRVLGAARHRPGQGPPGQLHRARRRRWPRCGEGEIDAFFWSGGVPTRGVADLAASVPIRLLDRAGRRSTPHAHLAYPEYAPGTVPAGTYGHHRRRSPRCWCATSCSCAPRCRTTSPYALVGRALQPPGADRPVQPQTALTIDMRAAIGTQPVPLHPGAENWFRAARNT